MTGLWPLTALAGGVLVLFVGAVMLSYLGLPFVLIWGARQDYKRQKEASVKMSETVAKSTVADVDRTRTQRSLSRITPRSSPYFGQEPLPAKSKSGSQRRGVVRAVLGIDAAWTATQPSGVAVVVGNSDGWRLVAVASSYEHFLAAPGSVTSTNRPLGSVADARALLSSAALWGQPIDLVAIDMPLALVPITRRRVSDDAVSRAYGGRKCGTHTPRADRPGRISDDLRVGFERAGFPLRTISIETPGVIEVYPHPVLVELSGASERLPYKAGKVRSYWPSLPPAERRVRLYRQWAEIVGLLEGEIAGIAAAMPELAIDASGAQLKGVRGRARRYRMRMGRCLRLGGPGHVLW